MLQPEAKGVVDTHPCSAPHPLDIVSAELDTEMRMGKSVNTHGSLQIEEVSYLFKHLPFC